MNKLRVYIFALQNGIGKAGLTLTDFEVDVYRVSKADGSSAKLVDEAAMGFEVGGGIYGYFHNDPDFLTYDYFSLVNYVGGEQLDNMLWLGGPDDADVSSRTTLQTGAIEWTYQLIDQETGLPIADADVWITTDQAGHNVIASGKTDQYGNVAFYLDAGWIYIWANKSGFNFSNPQHKEVP